MPKINFIVELDGQDVEMLLYLSNAFNMQQEELIKFLIFKQFYLYKHDDEKKASQIKANEDISSL